MIYRKRKLSGTTALEFLCSLVSTSVPLLSLNHCYTYLPPFCYFLHQRSTIQMANQFFRCYSLLFSLYDASHQNCQFNLLSSFVTVGENSRHQPLFPCDPFNPLHFSLYMCKNSALSFSPNVVKVFFHIYDKHYGEKKQSVSHHQHVHLNT